MKFARKFYAALQQAAMAHAMWDLEVSTSIIKDKRKVWLLAILTALGLMVSLAFADDLNLPSMLGGKKAYTPAFYTTGIFVASIAIGVCAGLITGCIGAGGGFIITPALMSAGIKGILAVGTDLFHIFAKAIMGTAVHKKLGNVSVGLAIAFLVGSGAGVLGGGVLNRMIYEANPVASDAFISVIYVVLLGFLGMYAMLDFLRLRKAGSGSDAHGGGAISSGGLPAKLQSAHIPPMISFDEDLIPGGKKISGLFVALCGVVVGFMAAIMGVGGGFLTFPMFVYVLGVSSFTTVGTDILQIIFTAGFAAISQYAIYGFIFYTLAMGMLLGSLLGIQIGALVTKLVPGLYIRGFYALAILAGFVNRLFAMPSKLNDMKIISMNLDLCAFLTNVGNWLFFLTIGAFAVWVIGTFLSKIKELREG
ncbi:sulfite exporter TauE/SafE family protein [Desulfovibrio sp. UCD-KL4C]|uniref:sulfite exporter TauE/SafE family protein n=1 Tax=Desulfovibrio sp. UCD-KL4C TaxID=2578120 RepID=UPI0025C16D6A|nr:sulfite exporter TauE/SafE family protein [Desulfovibrio sp. UCD-KL4C]